MKKKPKIVESSEEESESDFEPSPPPLPSSSSALPALPPLKIGKDKIHREKGGKESDSSTSTSTKTPGSASFERDRKGKGKERGREAFESDRDSVKDGGRGGGQRKRPKIEGNGIKEGGGSSMGGGTPSSGTPRDGGVKARITSELVGIGERKVGTPIGAGGEVKKGLTGVVGGEKKKEAGGFSLSSFLTVRPSYSTLELTRRKERETDEIFEGECSRKK